ncbi:MAG: amidohydrolase family protein [bacterium]
MYDLLIKGATVYDGSGKPGLRADVAVRDARIAEVGRIAQSAAEVVDAAGLALMPGIVDVHTHYDAQLTWDRTLSPSPALGVTTAVLGNCGFGIAPCPAPMRETMVKNLSEVEGMDLAALLKGTRWNFETFPQYLDQLRAVKPYANVAVLAQHSTIRTAVMGDEASSRAEPTAEELTRMQALVREALNAGAIGLASSFSPNHSGWAGRPMPSTIASDAELFALVDELGTAGRGVYVMATGSRATPEVMEAIAARSGRPAFMVTVLAMHNAADPGMALTYYERCAAACARGHEVYIHTSCQPLSFDFTLKEPYLLYSHDAFDRVKQAKGGDLAPIYADPAFRMRFRENLAQPKAAILFFGDWSKIELPDGSTVAERARGAGADPLDYFFDCALEAQLETRFVAKLYQNDDAGVAALLKHDAGVIALSDAGAHLIFLCDAGFGLHLLGHWVRETSTFTLAEGVRRLTSDPADKYRIPDRGRIAAGQWADLLLFDPSAVGISPLERMADLPGGGTRMIRRSRGVHGVWVNGRRIADVNGSCELDAGPGQVLTEFTR